MIQYSKALQIGKCRVDDEIVAMLRILHILSSSKEHDDRKKGHNDDVHLNLVPVQPWFRIVPQLFARLQVNSSGNIVIQKLLLRICRYAPHRIVYNLSAALQEDGEKNPMLSLLKQELEQNGMLNGVSQMSRELERITLLWEERWMLKLRDISKDIQTRWKDLIREALTLKRRETMSDQEKIRVFREMFKSKMHSVSEIFRKVASITIETQAETFHEIMFVKRYREDVKNVLRCLESVRDDVVSELVLRKEPTSHENDDVMIREDNNENDEDDDIRRRMRHRAWQHLHRFYRRLRDRVQSNHKLGLSMKALSSCLSSWQSRGVDKVCLFFSVSFVLVVCVCG